MIGPQRFLTQRWLMVTSLCMALVACGTGTDDLQDFVARIKGRNPPPIKAIPETPGYTPYTYKPAGRRSPFAVSKSTAPADDNGVQPDPGRPLDPLEHYPLDALQMVGTLTVDGTTYGLIEAPDQVVYRIAAGAHMGRHYGTVDAISPTDITLTEIVPKDNGGYQKRHAALAPSQ